MGIVSYIVPVLVLILVLKLLALPFKLIKRIIINSIVAGVILFVLSYLGIVVSLAWWGYALTGLFGIPGLIVVFILNAIF